MSPIRAFFARVSPERLREYDPRLVLIVGALCSSLVFIALAIVLLRGSLDSRPELRAEASLIMLQTTATTGATNLHVDLGGPIDLTDPEATVQLDITATVGEPDATTWLIFSEDIASGIEDCTQIRASDDVVPFAELDPVVQSGLALLSVRYPSRGSLDGEVVQAAGVDATGESISEQSYLVQPLEVEEVEEGFAFLYDFRSKNYPAWATTIQCSLALDVVSRSSGSWPIPLGGSTLVESIPVASRMLGGGVDAIARASYTVTVGDAADWTATRNTFSEFERTRDSDGASFWTASGDYWWRTVETELGVLQPAGYGLMEYRDAEEIRTAARLWAAFALTLAVGLVVIAARRIITRAASEPGSDG